MQCSIKLPITTLILVVFLGACQSSDKGNHKVAYSHFRLGVNLLAQGKKPEALEQFLIAKELDPDSALISNHLGLAYYFLQEYEHAVVALKEAIDLKPKYSEAHNNLGRVYIDMSDYSAARKHLSVAANDLTYGAKDKVWLNLGLSYFFENRYDKSESYFLKSISLNRNNCLGYNYYGRVQIEKEQYQQAAKALDQAIYHCKRKGFDEPHYYSAIAFFRLGFKEKAIARLEEGLKKFPKGPNREKIEEMIKLMKITETK